ncbi:putative glycerol-3-phosphate acyltransferase 3 [Canna indica]|uniref:Glycerol-3-phosphate acyltransferase 3 n=1 Tax=Canna indica TaxID=4628 RepID=A0AAQ3L4P9_9LILI|nr:putative glycerol-3-phosphate acyltransferase 3 [Canna indica]
MTSKSFSVLLSRLLLRSTPHAGHVLSLQKQLPYLEKLSTGKAVLLCHVEGGLLRSSSLFPYFMLVALEAGGLLRALLLLLFYPVICCLGHESKLRAMVMVSFCGLRKEEFRLGRTALPKLFLQDVGVEAFEVLRRSEKKVCVSAMPKVMVEGFLGEYLEVEKVVGMEMKVIGGYYSGLMDEDREAISVLMEELREEDVIGIGGCPSSLRHHQFLSLCKEVFIVSEREKMKWHVLPRSKSPKPLIFHDGRIAFRPTPLSTLSMFIWLPFAFLLAVARALVFLSLPYSFSVPLLSFSGMHLRVIPSSVDVRAGGSHIFISNHRTLLDPLYISAALGRRVTATTYSISRLSELLSPIRTVRLSRNREQDKALMKRLLEEEESGGGGGGLVVCPEGTTCREPCLLRFSSLFAEVSREVAPVALQSWVTVFYGTSTGKLKCLDPFYFLMNPSPSYAVEFMAKAATRRVGGRECDSREMANHLQGEIGKVLKFECTSLTRRDKYLVLAGNEGNACD